MDFEAICLQLRNASKQLAVLNAQQKNNALEAVSKIIDSGRSHILSANKLDVAKARKHGISESMLDRLTLTDARIDGMIAGIREVIALKDPVGSCVSGGNSDEGLYIRQVRVPIGVVAIIYESRPNVTVEAFSLAYKSGNALLLRGSSQAQNTNKVILDAIKSGLQSWQNFGSIPEAVELVCCEDRSDVDAILNAVGLIDVVLPRGGSELIRTVVERAKIPVIETGSGVCHLFVDESADYSMAINIAENAKIQRPGVCNAIEALLVHKNCAEAFLPKLNARFAGRVYLRCCKDSFAILQKNEAEHITLAEPGDFGREFLDYVLAIKVVNSLDEAIEFINVHNTKHSDAIITENIRHAHRFQQEVDAACVYVNASTRFTDGRVFGFGAELGISTQKFHARGPMGLEALTVTKFLIDGTGQIRER